MFLSREGDRRELKPLKAAFLAVAPAVATLALGKVYPAAIPDGDGFRFELTVQCTMCFDHRIANGVGAANMMNDIKDGIEQFSLT